MIEKKKKIRPFLYEDEVLKLLLAAKKSRYPLQNQSIILTTYNHSFRAGELCKLIWDDIDFNRNTIHVKRHKGGVDFYHDLLPSEAPLLIEMKEKRKYNSPFVYLTKSGQPFCRHSLKRLAMTLNEKANLDVYFHFHMLRHSKGHQLRSDGARMEDIRDYLGHKHIASTEIYTRMMVNRFVGINQGSRLATLQLAS